MKTFRKILEYTAWAISGIFILPCVFVSKVFFERWIDWMKSNSFKL